MIGKNLRYLRLKNNLSQDYIANFLGKKSYTTIQKWESGVNEPALSDSWKLANLFGVSIDNLFSLDLEEYQNRENLGQSFAYTFIPAKVSAGTLEDIEAVYDCPKMNVPDAMLGKYAHDRNIVFMGINGESMNNIIENGAIIAVKTDVERGSLKDGDIVVASSNGSYAVKHFINDVENERIILRPDSTDKTFTDTVIPYENADSLKIFGKVVIYSVVL